MIGTSSDLPHVDQPEFASGISGIARLQLRKVARAQGVACALLGGTLRGQIRLAGAVWQVSFAPALSVLERAGLRFSLEWEGIRCRASLSATGVETLLAPLLGPILTEQISESLLLALMQDLLDAAASDWGVARAEPIRMISLEHSDEAFPVAFEIRLVPEDGGDVVVIALEIEAEGVMRITERAAPLARSLRPNLQPWGNLPIPLALEIGWVDLPLTQLKTVRTQDILLMDGTWRGTEGEDANLACLRITPRYGVSIRVHPHSGITALQKIGNMEQEPLITSSDALGENEFLPPELAELTVRITFDLGERKLALRDLSAIEPGYVFDLGMPAVRAVNLRVNGVRVGEGELVEIDGRIGVAVTRFTPPL